MDKKEIAQVLSEIGTMLELLGESPFKSRAYYNGARTVELLTEDIKRLVQEDRLKDVKGIGKALDEKIKELVNTGRLEYYDRIKERVPEGLLELLRIPGLGPKKVRVLHRELGIATLGELEYSCIENRLIELPGFGERTQKKVLEGIQYLKRNRGRYLYPEALDKALRLVDGMKESSLVSRISIAGSLRRKVETVKDIDILVSGADPDGIMDEFAGLPWVERVIERGSSKLGALLDSGIGVDLRVVKDSQFPFALHHFTGSKEHNTAMRHRARGMGLKINEYGIFEGEGQSDIECADEEEFFERLGLQYIPPEIRENTGEIEAAQLKELPRLVEYGDIKGIFHVHTRYSDGTSSIQDLADKAMEMGMQYIGISDHSRSAYYAGGLKTEDVLRQREEIDRLNERYNGFKVFAGIESDILTDGSLDYPDEVLASFDFVIASVHSAFGMDQKTMTERLITALKNPHVTMLGHPTGRLILAREGYPVDLERIIQVAAGYNKMIELNANPYRLDLDWRWCRRAKEMGVRVSINPDAHSPEGLEDLVYGVDTARKGWLEAADVFNCISLAGMKELLEKA